MNLYTFSRISAYLDARDTRERAQYKGASAARALKYMCWRSRIIGCVIAVLMLQWRVWAAPAPMLLTRPQAARMRPQAAPQAVRRTATHPEEAGVCNCWKLHTRQPLRLISCLAGNITGGGGRRGLAFMHADVEYVPVQRSTRDKLWTTARLVAELTLITVSEVVFVFVLL